MKARFIGDPNDNFSGPQHMCMWGVDFVKGEWTPVTEPRFATNNHFEVDDGSEDGYEGMKVPALKALAAARGVDLTDVTLKADIIAALQLADEATEGGA